MQLVVELKPKPANLKHNQLDLFEVEFESFPLIPHKVATLDLIPDCHSRFTSACSPFALVHFYLKCHHLSVYFSPKLFSNLSIGRGMLISSHHQVRKD